MNQLTRPFTTILHTLALRLRSRLGCQVFRIGDGGRSATMQFHIRIVNVALAMILISCGDGAQWWNSNSSVMWVTKRRIIQYIRVHGHLPESLSQLPEMKGYDNSVKDAWGKALIYKVLPSGDISLTSLGRDGQIGGSGEDTDMTGIFSPLNADGHPQDELADWKVDPIPFKAQTNGTK